MRFHLVDRITAWYPAERAEGLKAFTRTGADSVPQTLIIEALAQLSSLLLGDSEYREGRRVLGLLSGLTRFEWHRAVRPGDVLQLSVHIVARKPEGARCVVEAISRSEIVATGQLSFVFLSAESEQQEADFAWTYEHLLGLCALCETGNPPRRSVPTA